MPGFGTGRCILVSAGGRALPESPQGQGPWAVVVDLVQCVILGQRAGATRLRHELEGSAWRAWKQALPPADELALEDGPIILFSVACYGCPLSFHVHLKLYCPLSFHVHLRFSRKKLTKSLCGQAGVFLLAWQPRWVQEVNSG